jgi:uncharacterized protein (TIGR02271 family)
MLGVADVRGDRPTGNHMPSRIPLLEEQLDVRKRTVDTAMVRVGKVIEERQETVAVPLRREDVEIRKVRVDRVVDRPVPTRQEGDVTIVSLHEEVVTRQLVLTEEWHITRRRSESCEPRQVTLRREDIDIDRTQADR